MNETDSTPKTEVLIVFFGGVGDGPGLFHTQIVERVAKAGFADPSKLGLNGVDINARSLYLEWSDAAFGRRKAANVLLRVVQQCPEIPVVIVGHSYGADAAIKTIRRLGIDITHLVTIDGVSRRAKSNLVTKPAKVRFWTNIYVTGVHHYSDIVARIGGHWNARQGADHNIDATEIAAGLGLTISHASFLSMWRMAVPYVRHSIGLSESS